MPKTAQKLFFYNLLLIFCVGITYFWSQSQILNRYSLQLVAFVIIVYILMRSINRTTNTLSAIKTIIDFFLLTLVVFLLVFSTGGLSSPIFFLIYFLLFAISLLLEPSAALSLAFISSIFFLITPKNELLAELLQLGSLFLITPLALIFGSQYINLLKSQQQISHLEQEQQNLKIKVEEKKKEIRNWTYIDFKNYMSNIYYSLNSLLADKTIQGSYRSRLENIARDLSQLIKSGKSLEEKVEK